MKEIIAELGEMVTSLKRMKVRLREQEWPSNAITLVANDMSTWLGMAASTAETLRRILSGLEEAKAEVKEIIEEEKGGEVPSEPVREPEDREAGDKVSAQEPGEQEPPGD